MVVATKDMPYDSDWTREKIKSTANSNSTTLVSDRAHHPVTPQASSPESVSYSESLATSSLPAFAWEADCLG